MAAETDKKVYPVKTRCTRCAHAGELFITDETVSRELNEDLKNRTWAVYSGFLARRFVALVLVAFLIGLALGFRLG